MSNPLLDKFENKFGCVPFDQIKDEHFLPALKEAIKDAKRSIDQIKNDQKTPSFEIVMEALEDSGEKVDRVATVFFNLHSANTSQERQDIAKEMSPLLTEFRNDIIFDQNLFEKIKTVYDHANKDDLTTEQWMLLEKTYKDFVRNGALLNQSQKDQLREIDKELSSVALLFGDHVLKDTNDYKLVVENEDDLRGLPESTLEAAALAAKEKGDEGKWVFTLDFPSFVPFMKYAENRQLRKKLFLAFSTRGFKDGETDNKDIVKKIAVLRYQRANLLGYKTHSHFVLEERMAGKPEKVREFIDDLLKYAKPAAEKEMDELLAFAKENGFSENLEKWDYSFWAEKLKKEKFNIDDEMLKPFFKLENVIEGVFSIAEKLYDISFEELGGIPTYHPDVKVYEIKKLNGDHVGVFYGDFFPRPGKRNGAWMTSYKGQKRRQGKEQRPHVSIVCNFTKPTSSKPSLLTFNEVTTLFHEFGHSLHGMLADTNYESLSGTNVYWDFVELPSQIMENWAYEKECLDMFAKHYETGEQIPFDLITKIKDSANFHEGRNSVRQLSFSMIDMAWHFVDPSNVENVEEYEREAVKDTELLPMVEGTNMSCSFSHIFAGGYSSGYYSYKWAEVLDADAFEFFKEKGIFNKEVSTLFKENILSKGGSDHPMSLYKKFRGKEPSPQALLKRSGLIK